MVCLRPGRRPQRWKIRVLCCARGVLLRHWWGVREHHAPTDARGTGWLGIGTEHALHTHTHYTHTHTHTPTLAHTPNDTHTHTAHTPTHTRANTDRVLTGYSQGTHECAAGTSAPHPTLLLPWVRPRPRRAARADLTPNRQRPSSTPQVRARSVVRQSIRGQRRGMGRAV